MTATANALPDTSSLASILAWAREENRIAEEQQRVDAEREAEERRARNRDELAAGIFKTLGFDGDIRAEERIEGSEDYEIAFAVATIEGTTFGFRKTNQSSYFGHDYDDRGLVVARPCTKQCGQLVWMDVGSPEGLAYVLEMTCEHFWDCRNERSAPPPKKSSIDDAIDAFVPAADRVAAAYNRIAELEDQRALIKPEAIKRLMEAGHATSVTGAEKIVEQDAAYAIHRAAQRDAEREKWAALAAWEAAVLRGKLAVAAGGAL